MQEKCLLLRVYIYKQIVTLFKHIQTICSNKSAICLNILVICSNKYLFVNLYFTISMVVKIIKTNLTRKQT